MSLPLNWMVLLFFLFNVAIVIIIFAINSKFKWRMIANNLEFTVAKLKSEISSSHNFKEDFTEAIKEIKEKLTERQFEIFLLIVEGLSSKEIAKIINLAPNTIDSNVKDICKNLKVKKRSQLGAIFFNKLKEKAGLEKLLEI